MDFSEKQRYIGHLSQLFDVKTYQLTGGKQEGVAAVDITTGAGLEVTVLPDRCMDLYQIKFRGINCNFHTPSGIVAPAYYDNRGNEWLRNFFAGFLTTCGLTTTGEGSQDGGETLGIHGRIANTPAERFAIEMREENGVPQVVLRGVMREAVLFGDCLTLTREIICTYGQNSVRLHDTVENIGPRTAPHMILYHFNMGYPLLCEQAKLRIPSQQVTPRSAHAAETLSSWERIDPPAYDQEESCYYHDVRCDAQGIACVGIDNPSIGMGVRIRFDKKVLPYFVQWRMLGCGEYVMGLEPANAPIDGRNKARADGRLPFLKPGEKVEYTLEVEAIAL